MPAIFSKFKKFVAKCSTGIRPIVLIGTVGTLFFFHHYHSIKRHLKIPTHVLETEKFNKKYIYLPTNSYSDGNSRKKAVRQFIKEVLPAPLAKIILLLDRKSLNLAEDYEKPWSVLHQAYSRNQEIRLRAVETIASYKDWSEEKDPVKKQAKLKRLEDCISLSEIESYDLDAECRSLAQSIDCTTAVGLARTHDVDLRLFLPPPPLPPVHGEDELEDELRELLTKLPNRDVDKCIQHFTVGALHKSDDKAMERGGKWCFGGNGLKYAPDNITQGEIELLCLQALAKHSAFQEHCKVMVDEGALQLLQNIRKYRPEHKKIQQTIIRIVSNICLYEELHSQIFQSGWVTLLAESSKSKYVSLRIQASRGLANLDREASKEKFKDGIYVFYPRHRTSSTPEADIVFIHGIMGGAFHSWRQQTSSAYTEKDKTHSWPEDWMPRDLPGCRVMCVEYDTDLSEWLSLCPHENDKRTISYRSNDILEKLLKAGIGDRPIVWVVHSMGGLLVKHMLLQARLNPNRFKNLSEQTKGIVFFGTPHFGSQLAKYSLRGRLILFPSVEVMELSQDSPKLNELHESFKKMVRKTKLQVLSFGEKHSTNIGLGLKLHIVPLASADPGIGDFIPVDTNHLNLCKPTGRQSVTYQRTVKFIASALAAKHQEDDEEEEPDDHQVLL